MGVRTITSDEGCQKLNNIQRVVFITTRIHGFRSQGGDGPWVCIYLPLGCRIVTRVAFRVIPGFYLHSCTPFHSGIHTVKSNQDLYLQQLAFSLSGTFSTYISTHKCAQTILNLKFKLTEYIFQKESVLPDECRCCSIPAYRAEVRYLYIIKQSSFI